MKKILFIFLLSFFLSSGLNVFAQEYILFYGNGCPNCQKVENFLEDSLAGNLFDVKQKEIYFNKVNREELNGYMEKLKIDQNQIGVPFLVINDEELCEYINGADNIITYFQNKLDEDHPEGCEETILQKSTEEKEANKSQIIEKLKFFAIMLPAAISDSINPCAFAVMFLLLNTILTKHKSRRKTILAGFMFSLAVFLTYLAMGIGLFSALASASNTFYLKLGVGILGILVGLANIKDYFRYGKFFVMEVPFSRRPKMMSLIEKISSPMGAFFIGILVSLFLLPCSSGPYFTILGYLSAETKVLNLRGYIYLVVYNLIFILPMFVIALLVGFGHSSVEKLAKIKHKNTKLIHLIVGLLMLGLGLYVLLNL